MGIHRTMQIEENAKRVAEARNKALRSSAMAEAMARAAERARERQFEDMARLQREPMGGKLAGSF